MARFAPVGAAPLHLTLIGHSYGSLAVGYAMRRRPAVDDVVLLGSPGAAARHARDLLDDPGHVFVGEARGDAVADLGWFNTDPSSPRFGARQLQTDGGVDPVTQVYLRASHGHSDYLSPATESVRNVAAVVTGRPEAATYGDMSGSGDRILDGYDWSLR
jgi:pimeloyl-ACP methyl ester carboxylesterase